MPEKYIQHITKNIAINPALVQGEVFILRYNNLMEMLTRSAGEKEFPIKIPVCGWILFIVILAVGWKVIWLAVGAFPFNSDEAITGLMARHILQGERPVFFYGQAYMGSLDAFLAAGLFSLLGDTVLSIRVLQILLYTCTIISTAWLGWKLTHSWETGLMAAELMAIPAVNVTLYTTVSLGGYGEALVLSNCAFLCAIQLQTRQVGGQARAVSDILLFGLLGFITGLGFWVFGLSLVATIPASIFGVIALWKRLKKEKWVFPVALLAFATLFFLGSSPWLLVCLQAGLGTPIRELFGSAFSVEKGNWLTRTGNHLFYYIFLGLPAI